MNLIIPLKIQSYQLNSPEKSCICLILSLYLNKHPKSIENLENNQLVQLDYEIIRGKKT